MCVAVALTLVHMAVIAVLFPRVGLMYNCVLY